MTIDIVLICLAVLIFSYLFLHFAQIAFSPEPQKVSYVSVCISENCFESELATTSAQIEKGLMHRSFLPENKGMLFVFAKEGIYSFWMKNTLIPLDIIWINDSKKIVFIEQNTKPCKSLVCQSYNPGVKARYVLEINAGLAEKYRLKIDDLVQITPSL